MSVRTFTQVSAYPTDEHPDAHQLFLVIGVQSFLISDGVSAYFETKAAAEWAQDQLDKAIDNISRSES